MTSSDEPAYFPAGAAVAAKFRGAFCAATVKSVKRNVRVKATVLSDQRTVSLDYDALQLVPGGSVAQVKAGETLDARLPDSGEVTRVTVVNVKDNSEYTVDFNDGDEKILRRSQILPQSPPSFSDEAKSAREDEAGTSGGHSGTPSRTRSRPVSRASSDRSVELDLCYALLFAAANPDAAVEADGGKKGGSGSNGEGENGAQKQPSSQGSAAESPASTPGRGNRKLTIGDAVIVREDKGKWFPGLVVSHLGFKAADINVRREVAVRNFKDGRTVVSNRKDVQIFDKSRVSVTELSGTLKIAVEKCLQYMDQGVLPPHWDKNALLRKEAQPDQTSSDEELPVSQEERDRFVAYLYKFMDERGTPINKQPTIGTVDLDLYRLHSVVNRMGGCNRVTKGNDWKTVLVKMKLEGTGATPNGVKAAYGRYLSNFDAFYRKLGIPADEINRVYLAKVPGSGSRHPSGVAAAGASSAEQERSNEVGATPAVAKPSPDRRLLPMSVRRTMNQRKKQSMRQNQANRRLTVSWLSKARRVLGGTRMLGQVAPPSRPTQAQSSPASVAYNVGASDRRSIDKRDSGELTWLPVEKHDGLWVGRMVKIKYGMGDMKRNYQAKIMKIEMNRAQPNLKRYYVHYFGWNSRYDEYVDRSRIMLVTQKDDGNKFSTSAAAERKILLAARSPITGLAPSLPGPGPRARRESGKPQSVKSCESGGKRADSDTAGTRKRRLSSLSQNQADKDENGGKRPRPSSRRGTGGPNQTPVRAKEGTPDVDPPQAPPGNGDDSDFSSAETDSIRSWGKASSAPSRPSPRFTPSYEMPAVMEEYAAQEANRWQPSRSESAPRTRQRRILRRRDSSNSKFVRPTDLPLDTSAAPSGEAFQDGDDKSIGVETDVMGLGGCTPRTTVDDDDFDESWTAGGDEQSCASGTSGKAKKPPQRRRRKKHSHMPTSTHKRGGRTPRHQTDQDGEQGPGARAPGGSSPPYTTSTAALRQKIIQEMNSDPNYPPSKYTFDVFDPNLKGEEKVNECLQRLNQIREIYTGLKAKLADLDRRRRKTIEKKKKLMKKKAKEDRKKEREANIAADQGKEESKIFEQNAEPVAS